MRVKKMPYEHRPGQIANGLMNVNYVHPQLGRWPCSIAESNRYRPVRAHAPNHLACHGASQLQLRYRRDRSALSRPVEILILEAQAIAFLAEIEARRPHPCASSLH